ncbi:hypothetical protein [Clostridium thermobutyricum]|uniref:Uncharacterized protein n=1 Tax=Clostridium thermobutyricum DSM 4928 TaxID=1121339 RepID=A0A1V4SW73_9CLOT|nr:hypothetical protein [Clostridium thermobutyricum]OPX48486.1 hypothetical protein CLTHE_11640 [Clostridium thermobutyricum DSM 4928]
MDKQLVEEIKLRLETNRYELQQLDKKYLKAFAPEGYKSGTSYNDYDTIHGSRQEYRIEEFALKRERLIKAIKYDEKALFKRLNEIDLNKYLESLDTKECIDYLRNVEGFTYQRISEQLGISVRYIQRVCKKLKKS